MFEVFLQNGLIIWSSRQTRCNVLRLFCPEFMRYVAGTQLLGQGDELTLTFYLHTANGETFDMQQPGTIHSNIKSMYIEQVYTSESTQYCMGAHGKGIYL